MDLYASGFNAWRQLEFDHDEPSDLTTNEPEDITSFRLVLSDALIELPCALLSCTFVKTSSGLRHAGFADKSVETAGLREKLLASTAAIAGNGSIAVYDGGVGSIQQYDSMRSFAQASEQRRFPETKQVVQLVAYETGFVALTRDGCVWSWGDERYAACLGREITPSSPAERPGIIEELEDLPTGKIVKVAAAGYVVLALTEGHDLYAWGGHPGRQAILGDLTGSPAPVLVEECDILDCGAGDSHIIALTVDGDVYVIGDNANGQLGLGVEKTATWVKVPLSLEEAQSVIGVRAGQRSSFILTKRHVP
ncbi:RCC1/BLIP-II [Biscogniauxia mediterranea]|nr:RCC1/BLIP-II [Biscogniauxia mediterranea]